MNGFTLAEYLQPYMSALNSQGNISGVSVIFDHLDSITNTDTKSGSYECHACNNGLGSSSNVATC